MNLVAKEYVAAQPADDPGVLVLSSFAGAAEHLPEAIIINPLDPEDIVESFDRALAMPLAERRERWNAMFDEVRRNGIAEWRSAFVASLADR
jgi:trehalose 6-phosphate synthase